MAEIKTKLDIKELQVKLDNLNQDVCGLTNDVKKGFETLNSKLDGVISSKADRDEVKGLEDKVNRIELSQAKLIAQSGIVVAVIYFLIEMALKKFWG